MAALIKKKADHRPPVFLIHDWFSGPESDWKSLTEHISSEFEVYYYNLPGHSNSQGLKLSPGQPIFDQAMAELVGQIQGQNRPVFMITRGVGGLPMLKAASMLPEAIAGVIWVNPVVSLQHGRILARLAARFPIMLGLWLLFYDPLAEGVSFWRRFRDRRSHLKGQAAGAYLKLMLSEPYLGELHHYEFPALLIGGDQSPFESSKLAEDLNAEFSNSQLIRYAHLGHNIHLEEPWLLQLAVMQFLQTHNKSWQNRMHRFKRWLRGLVRNPF